MLNTRKTHRTAILALLTAFLLVLAATATAQDWKGRGRVQLVILDQEGKPIPEATVTLYYGTPGNGPEVGTASKKGKFGMLGLRSGGWTFLVEKEGYVAAEGRLPVSEFKPANQTITLRKAEATEATPDAQEIMGNIQQANALLGQGKYAEARALYLEAMPKVLEDSQPMLKRAVAQTYLAEEKWTEALTLIDEVLVAMPGDVDTLKMKARAQGAAGQTDAAIATLDTLAAGGDVDALKLIISLLLGADREEEAKVYMAKLPEGEKVDANALLNTGIDKYNDGDVEGALVYFDRAAAENPDLPDVYYYRGLANLAQGETEKAKADFEKLIELAPNHERVPEAKEFLAAL